MRCPRPWQAFAGALCTVAASPCTGCPANHARGGGSSGDSIARDTEGTGVPPGERVSILPGSRTPIGRPYGFWGLNGYTSREGLADVAGRYGITVFQTACADPAQAVRTLLPMVRAAGMRVTLRMTPDHEAYTDRAGDFDLQAWKSAFSAWEGSGVEEFVADGTLAGHMVLDDIRTFAGRDPTAAELDEMARHSKELLPGLVTFVREDASALPRPDGGTYIWLDATVNQYHVRKGPVDAYATREAAEAGALGLGVINGLNLCDGGDGSSGQPGWREGHYAMSADEITDYGTVLAAVPSGMFLGWEYDAHERWSDGTIGSEYFDQPELQAALAELGALLATQPAQPLLRPSPVATPDP